MEDIRAPKWLSSKESACNAGNESSIPRLGRSPGQKNGNLLQHSCLETPWTEEPGGLQSMGLQRAGGDLGTKQQQYSIVYI